MHLVADHTLAALLCCLGLADGQHRLLAVHMVLHGNRHVGRQLFRVNVHSAGQHLGVDAVHHGFRIALESALRSRLHPLVGHGVLTADLFLSGLVRSQVGCRRSRGVQSAGLVAVAVRISQGNVIVNLLRKAARLALGIGAGKVERLIAVSFQSTHRHKGFRDKIPLHVAAAVVVRVLHLQNHQQADALVYRDIPVNLPDDASDHVLRFRGPASGRSEKAGENIGFLHLHAAIQIL